MVKEWLEVDLKLMFFELPYPTLQLHDEYAAGNPKLLTPVDHADGHLTLHLAATTSTLPPASSPHPATTSIKLPISASNILNQLVQEL